MNKLPPTYSLLVIVLIIWGALIFRLLDSLGGSGTPTEMGYAENKAFDPIQWQQKDTFSLHAFERDPFLGKLREKVVTKVAPARSAIPTEVSWPQIQYKGMISSGSSGENLFFIEVDGVSSVLAKGEMAEGVLILGGDVEKVSVSFQGAKKMIALEQQ